jgi:hypothetical protein
MMFLASARPSEAPRRAPLRGALVQSRAIREPQSNASKNEPMPMFRLDGRSTASTGRPSSLRNPRPLCWLASVRESNNNKKHTPESPQRICRSTRGKKQTHHHGGDPVRIDWQALFITLSSLCRLHKRLWRRLRRRVPGMRSLLYRVLPRPDGLLSDHWSGGLFAVFSLPFLDGRFEYTAYHLGYFLTTGM